MRRAAAAALLLALTACSGGGGGADDGGAVEVRGGSCLALAEDLDLVRGYAAQSLEDHPDGPPVDPADVPLLRREAERFRQGLRLAREPVTAPLTALVAALDEVNRRLADGSYAGPGPFRELSARADALDQACTSRGPALRP